MTYFVVGYISFFVLLYVGAMFAINRRIKQNKVKEIEGVL